VVDESRRIASDAAREVHEALSAHAAAARVLPAQHRELAGYTGDMLLNAAYLVDAERADEIRARTRRGLERLLFDTAPSFTWSPLEIGWAAARLGPARLALGSDYPVGADPRVLRDAVAHVRALPLDAADRARIAGANAAAFLGLPAN
jgi:predicted TIM-barrel fold metal-dependent hydrolase